MLERPWPATEGVMDDYMFVAVCPCGRRTMATKGSPALCIGCLEKLFAEAAANPKSNPESQVSNPEWQTPNQNALRSV